VAQSEGGGIWDLSRLTGDYPQPEEDLSPPAAPPTSPGPETAPEEDSSATEAAPRAAFAAQAPPGEAPLFATPAPPVADAPLFATPTPPVPEVPEVPDAPLFATPAPPATDAALFAARTAVPAEPPSPAEGWWAADVTGSSTAPPPPGSGSRNRLVVPLAIAAALLVAVVAGVTFLVLSAGGRDVDASARNTVAAIVTASPTTTDSATPETTTTPESSPTPSDPEAAAIAQLESLREQSLQSVSAHGQWVAQLASKYPGISDDLQASQDGGHVFHAADILAEHLALSTGANNGADIVLVLSSDYGTRHTYQGHTLWVTLALDRFESRAQVQAWCQSRFPGFTGQALANRCLPQRFNAPS